MCSSDLVVKVFLTTSRSVPVDVQSWVFFAETDINFELALNKPCFARCGSVLVVVTIDALLLPVWNQEGGKNSQRFLPTVACFGIKLIKENQC